MRSKEMRSKGMRSKPSALHCIAFGLLIPDAVVLRAYSNETCVLFARKAKAILSNPDP